MIRRPPGVDRYVILDLVDQQTAFYFFLPEEARMASVTFHEQLPQEPKTEELPLEERERRAGQRRLAERRLRALAAAVREHEHRLSERPLSLRHADLSLYRRLRQIAGEGD